MFKEEQKKKVKFEVQKDEKGNIVYPIQINQSLKLLNIGDVSTLPAYHSEHNIFPIGFKTVRSHASMMIKGAKAEYTCEILEGPDQKPLYK